MCVYIASGKAFKNGSFQSPVMLIRDLDLLCFKPHVAGAGGIQQQSGAYAEAELSSVIRKITVSCFAVLCPVIISCFNCLANKMNKILNDVG